MPGIRRLRGAQPDSIRPNTPNSLKPPDDRAGTHPHRWLFVAVAVDAGTILVAVLIIVALAGTVRRDVR